MFNYKYSKNIHMNTKIKKNILFCTLNIIINICVQRKYSTCNSRNYRQRRITKNDPSYRLASGKCM